jgi:dTDP-4-dehydrorhamnose reductase
VVVLGGSGFVGSRVVELWRATGAVLAPTRAELDVLDPRAVQQWITHTPAQVVVNLAAWADVDGAEAERGNQLGQVYRLNVDVPRTLAEACRASGKHLIHVSTDYVFSGTNAERPYREDDPVGPLCWYAITKEQGERAVRETNPAACIARIEMPFSGLDRAKQDIARIFQARLSAGQPVVAVTDQRITPLLLDDAAHALALLVEDRSAGIVHLASTTWTTPHAYAHGVASRLGLDDSLIQAATLAQFAGTRPAQRPQHSWLDVTLFEGRFGTGVLRSIDDELDAWAAQRLARTARAGDVRPAQSVRLE